MKVLDHKDITAAMLVASSVAEPDLSSAAPWWSTPGEVEWSAGTAYTGQSNYVIRPTTHRVYRSLQSSTGKVPETNPLLWEDVGPTNRWAPFDMKTSTAVYAASPYVHVLRPGLVSDLDLAGLKNVANARLVVRDLLTGDVLYDETRAAFWWVGNLWLSYYFDLPLQRYRLTFTGLPAQQNTEFELTVTSTDGQPLQLSQVAYGRYVELGCAEFGMEMKVRTFGGVNEDDFGNTTIKTGLVVVDLAGSDVVQSIDANRVAQFVLNNRNRSMVWQATDDPLYDYLSTTGVADVSIRAEGPTHARMTINIQGIGA